MILKLYRFSIKHLIVMIAEGPWLALVVPALPHPGESKKWWKMNQLWGMENIYNINNYIKSFLFEIRHLYNRQWITCMFKKKINKNRIEKLISKMAKFDTSYHHD